MSYVIVCYRQLPGSEELIPFLGAETENPEDFYFYSDRKYIIYEVLPDGSFEIYKKIN